MPATVFALVLFSAALHAAWNLLIKGASDKFLMTVTVTASAGIVGLLGLPFFPPPARESWAFIAASGCASVLYFRMVAATYKAADLSLAYPVMRGSAPLLVGVAGVPLFGEQLSLTAWIAIGVVSAGIFSLALVKHEHGSRGLILAFATALLIAACTLIDAEGARRSGSPGAYTLWIFALTGLLLAIWAAIDRGDELPGFVRRNWRVGLIAGGGALGSYGIALWAMTVASVALVAALRETTVMFGAALAALILKERIGPTGLAAIAIIAAGAVLLRMA